MNVPANGYRWWYIDGRSDDGRFAIVVIAFVGSVFSPYYAWARRRGEADAGSFCALNVALYGGGRSRWCMTERGGSSVARSTDAFVIGPSALRWVNDGLTLDIREWSVPLPRAVAGRIRVEPLAIANHPVALDGDGNHVWRCISPAARIGVDFDKPEFAWEGEAYVDTNWGSTPLETAFRSWTWSRALLAGSSAVFYDVAALDGSRNVFALGFDRTGAVSTRPLPPEARLPRTGWRLDRHTRSEAAAKIVMPLEDTPFYARAVTETAIDGRLCQGVHETLSLERFRRPLVQAMLPFRMPRRP